MGSVRRWCWLAVIVVLGIGCQSCRGCRGPSKVAGPTTALQLEAFGGFAYVPTQNQLEIAYLKDTNYKENPSAITPDCKVDQLGVDLMVVDGNIIEPTTAPPGDPNALNTKMFDLGGAVVTFPDLETANLPLTATRSPRPTGAPFAPVPTTDEAKWANLMWVPKIKDEFPSSSLNPNWRDTVDGRLVLRGGTFKGLLPSDVVVRDALFEFRKSGTPQFKQAITDRTDYSVQVPNDRVVMNVLGARSGLKQIVVTPTAPGRPVMLKLMGRHRSGPLNIGDEVTDYCAFYTLLQPVPPVESWLKLYYIGIPGSVAGGAAAGAGSAVAGGQPSPGPFCPGGGF